ncbi:MAG: hypothetical protein GVY20_03980 [Bacteroidetes bacterium]|jgi:hypothetical protein|nr:hypothetical protein [Bacteroidota bacterium]
MLNRIRNISARFTLLVYLTSFLAVALFHYHDYAPLSDGDLAGTIVSVSHQNTGESNSDGDIEHCSLCLITNVQFDAFSNAVPSLNYLGNQNFSAICTVITIPFIDYSPKRAPPVTA